MTKRNPPRQEERRRHPRLSVKLPLRVEGRRSSLEAVEGEVSDISLCGVYCRAPCRIPLFSRVHMSIILPFKRNGRSTRRVIQAEGVVVRVKKGKCTSRFAVYFQRIHPADLAALRLFIASMRQSGRVP